MQRLETLYHDYEIAYLVDGSHVEIGREDVVGDATPDACLVFVGTDDESVDGSLAYASRWIVDDAQQSLLVFGIDDDAEIGQQVLDFLAVVERKSTIYFIRY